MNSPTPSGPPDGPLHTHASDNAAQRTHPARSRRSVLTVASATLAGLLVGVLIGFVADTGGGKAATPATATSTQTVLTTPGAVEAPASSPSSSKPLAFGATWKVENTDPAKPFEGNLTVLGYKQGFTSVGKADEGAGEPGYVWAWADLKLCGTKGSYTDNTDSWTLYYDDGGRIKPSGTTYGDFPKPEFPFEVTVTAGKCAWGKLAFAVPGDERPESVLYQPDGLDEPREWLVPNA
ncbi:hypothetical protein [Streptomyces sp. RP5T]|uniref:hypothetical protein n=1 Tax=Streptomyces sp. RP5T TaxID=2490848 RepID=UPI000F64A557|nr:hypothetical protein [Streptomyces sp. RP5T]